MITAQQAVDDLYRIAVTEKKATSTARLDSLAEYCVQELNRRGLHGVEKEASVPGAGRQKRWDVAWEYDGNEVDFGEGSPIRSLSQPFDAFFDTLIEQVSVRNPNAIQPP